MIFSNYSPKQNSQSYTEVWNEVEVIIIGYSQTVKSPPKGGSILRQQAQNDSDVLQKEEGVIINLHE